MSIARRLRWRLYRLAALLQGASVAPSSQTPSSIPYFPNPFSGVHPAQPLIFPLMMLKVPPSPVLQPMTSGSFVVVQKVPLGTLTPAATGVPGGGLDDARCGVGVATTAATRAKAVTSKVDRILILFGKRMCR